jgi:catechol 2,3-dioxygenase-like lactoylglutathione lyase family enzyme
VRVSSLDASIAWYRHVLGFDLVYRLEQIAWCELKTGVARVNIGLSEVEAPGGKGGATLTFGVADIDAAKAELDRHNVRQDGRSATFRTWSGCSPSSIPTTMRCSIRKPVTATIEPRSAGSI